MTLSRINVINVYSTKLTSMKENKTKGCVTSLITVSEKFSSPGQKQRQQKDFQNRLKILCVLEISFGSNRINTEMSGYRATFEPPQTIQVQTLQQIQAIHLLTKHVLLHSLSIFFIAMVSPITPLSKLFPPPQKVNSQTYSGLKNAPKRGRARAKSRWTQPPGSCSGAQGQVTARSGEQGHKSLRNVSFYIAHLSGVEKLNPSLADGLYIFIYIRWFICVS